jgi:hypothetical protein
MEKGSERRLSLHASPLVSFAHIMVNSRGSALLLISNMCFISENLLRSIYLEMNFIYVTQGHLCLVNNIQNNKFIEYKIEMNKILKERNNKMFYL